jgi:hypothetical protein
VDRIFPEVENLGLPILITISDASGHPVPGAYVALKRIGLDGGYQESDIMSRDSSRSDEYGNAVILYPNWAISISDNKGSSDSPDDGGEAPRLHLLGAVTVVAEGYETGVLELEQATEAAKIPISSNIYPGLTIVLSKKEPTGTR